MRIVLLLVSLVVATISLACGSGPPTDKMALQRCQSLARGEMPPVVGNPRYRINKSQIYQTNMGPKRFEYEVKGEYFFKAANSGDSEFSAVDGGFSVS